jgi:hypothetical protein
MGLSFVEGIMENGPVRCEHQGSQVIEGFDLVQELRMLVGVQGLAVGIMKMRVSEEPELM